MALLAEELVEEWLNREGYFTIRGVKLGVHEIDLLAIRFRPDGSTECRHIEVQASMRPVSYLTDVPKAQQKKGTAPTSAKLRSDDELRIGISEWIGKKFDQRDKVRLRERLAPGPWSRELVVNAVKHERELELIKEAGITVYRLPDVIAAMRSGEHPVEAAAGAHLLDLVTLTAAPNPPGDAVRAKLQAAVLTKADAANAVRWARSGATVAAAAPATRDAPASRARKPTPKRTTPRRK